jgi:modulator of FtsH protease HflK
MMKADPLAFARATRASLIGLIIQVGISLTFLLYSVFGQDTLAETAFYYSVLGIVAWIVLTLVFHQHKLERIEAASEELLSAAGAEEASVFEGNATDFRVAAARLAWMHRFLVPTVSLLLGALLVGLGVWRFANGRSHLDVETFSPPEFTGWAVSLGLGIAIVGFVFARYVAGMAKQTVWANLRAGAATAVGASLAGLLLTVAHGISYIGSDLALRYMHVIFPAIMIILGVEVFLNFILNIYRPRHTGEVPRPAFDSRILGFIAAPDKIAESLSEAINYQFGFEVSSTWFYQLLSRSITYLVILGIAILWLLTSFAVVDANERGIITQFGAYRKSVEAGFHLKAPWPIQSLQTFPARSINELTIGTPKPTGLGPILWTEPHGSKEQFQIVQSDTHDESQSNALDISLLAVELPIQYEVDDLRKYIELAADSTNASDPDSIRRRLLTNVASRVFIEYLGTRSVNEILGPKRSEINEELLHRIRIAFDDLNGGNGAGVNVLFASIAGVHPPSDDNVALTFENVVAAEQFAETTIAQSEALAIETLTNIAGDVALAKDIVVQLDQLEAQKDAKADPALIASTEASIDHLLSQAGGQAAIQITLAKAERWEKHMRVRTQAIRQGGQIALYRAAPAAYISKSYFRTILDSVRNARVYITAFDEPHIRLNFEEIQSNIGGFDIREANQLGN